MKIVTAMKFRSELFLWGVWHSPEWPCSPSWSCTRDLQWRTCQALSWTSGRAGRGTGRGSRKTGEERHSKNNTQVRMHGWHGMTHKARPWAKSAMCEHCASTDGARRAQNCALYTSVCFVVSVPLFAMCSRLFMSVCRSQMFVNMRCRIHSLYTPRRWQ